MGLAAVIWTLVGAFFVLGWIGKTFGSAIHARRGAPTLVEEVSGTASMNALVQKRARQGYRVVAQSRSATGKNIITFQRP